MSDYSVFLKRIRRSQRVIDRVMVRIEALLRQSADEAPDWQREAAQLWGARENAAGALLKLAQAQIKWAELEFDVLRAHAALSPPAQDGFGDWRLGAEDYAIMEEALKRRHANRLAADEPSEDDDPAVE